MQPSSDETPDKAPGTDPRRLISETRFIRSMRELGASEVHINGLYVRFGHKHELLDEERDGDDDVLEAAPRAKGGFVIPAPTAAPPKPQRPDQAQQLAQWVTSTPAPFERR